MLLFIKITFEDFIMYWFIFGIVYTIINGAFRKIYVDGMLLPMAHLMFGPVFLCAIIIRNLERLRVKIENVYDSRRKNNQGTGEISSE